MLKSDLVQNLFICTINYGIAGAEVEIIDKKNRETYIIKKIKEVEDEYDFIFIDCPPSLGVLNYKCINISRICINSNTM